MKAKTFKRRRLKYLPSHGIPALAATLFMPGGTEVVIMGADMKAVREGWAKLTTAVTLDENRVQKVYIIGRKPQSPPK